MPYSHAHVHVHVHVHVQVHVHVHVDVDVTMLVMYANLTGVVYLVTVYIFIIGKLTHYGSCVHFTVDVGVDMDVDFDNRMDFDVDDRLHLDCVVLFMVNGYVADVIVY